MHAFKQPLRMLLTLTLIVLWIALPIQQSVVDARGTPHGCPGSGSWHGYLLDNNSSCGYFSGYYDWPHTGMLQKMVNNSGGGDYGDVSGLIQNVPTLQQFFTCLYNGDQYTGPSGMCDNHVTWAPQAGAVKGHVIADYYISELEGDVDRGYSWISDNAVADQSQPYGSSLSNLDLPPLPNGQSQLQDAMNRLANYGNTQPYLANGPDCSPESIGSSGHVCWDIAPCQGSGPDSSYVGVGNYQQFGNGGGDNNTDDVTGTEVNGGCSNVMAIYSNGQSNPVFEWLLSCGNDLTTNFSGLIPAPSEYHLSPSVSATSSAYVEPGTPNPITFQALISNFGCKNNTPCSTASAGSYSCSAENVYTIPGYYNGGALPAPTPMNPALGCNIDIPQGGGPPGGSPTVVGTFTVANPGNNGSLNRTICAQFTVNNSDLAIGDITPSGSKTSQLTCVYVVQKPYFKVYNGDVSAGDGLNCSSNSNAIIESWNTGGSGAGTQYATYAASVIDQFASAQNNHSVVAPTGLAFANTGGTYGGSLGTALSCNQDYYAKLPAGTPTLPVGNPPAGTFYVDGTGPTGATIGSGGSFTLAPGQQTTIYVNGNLTINENIKYPSSFSLNQLPSFKVIVSGNIYIDNTVTQLDGTYVAQANATANTGTIFTCGDYGVSAAQLTNGTWLAANCTNSLTVNGSFVANAVDLLRVHDSLYQSSGDSTAQQDGGSEDSNGNGTFAAEVFNYNSATWLQSPNAASNNNYNTITSLPPVL